VPKEPKPVRQSAGPEETRPSSLCRKNQNIVSGRTTFMGGKLTADQKNVRENSTETRRP